MPFFSVITPSYNQGPYLEACLRSVVEQQDADFEHLVFDNCSTDTTPDVLSRHPQVKGTVEKDRGQSHAINKGLAAARGEIICWLNSDDAYPPGTFQKLRELFAEPKTMVVFGDALQIDYGGGKPQVSQGRFGKRIDLVRWWSRDVRLHQPAVFFRRSVSDAVGPLNEDLHYIMDYEYWWRISELYVFQYCPAALAIQHRQPDSKTIRQWHKVYEEREKVFSPFYDLIDHGNRAALFREKRRTMAERYLGEAYACADHRPGLAMKCLWRSFRENPSYVLHPRTLGVCRKMIFK